MPIVTIPKRQMTRRFAAKERSAEIEQEDSTGVTAGSAAPADVDVRCRVLGLLFLLVGAAIGWYYGSRKPPLFLKPDINVFAMFYIFAQALERGFELAQMFFPALGRADGENKNKKEAIEERNTKLAAALNTGDKVDEAAKAQQVVDRVRLNRAVLAWTFNSAIAMAGAGWLGLRLIGSITSPEWPYSGVDAILTGLVIGAGTKPLHDLIGKLQTSKQKNEDPPAAGGK